MNNNSILHSLRVIAGCFLFGATAAGTLFGWVGLVGIHELGAAFGVAFGVVAAAKHVL